MGCTSSYSVDYADPAPNAGFCMWSPKAPRQLRLCKSSDSRTVILELMEVFPAGLQILTPLRAAAPQTSLETSAPSGQPHKRNTADADYSRNNPGGNPPPGRMPTPLPPPSQSGVRTHC